MNRWKSGFESGFGRVGHDLVKVGQGSGCRLLIQTWISLLQTSDDEQTTKCGNSRAEEARIRLIAGAFQDFLFLVLELVQLGIQSAELQQFLVRALFLDLAFEQNEDTIDVLNC